MVHRRFNTLIFLLVFADLVFILLHISQGLTGYPKGSGFSIAQDHGYAEKFQYIKELFSVGLLLLLSFRYKSLLMVAWSLLYGYIFLDDNFLLHEKVGKILAKSSFMSDVFGMIAKDIGEVAFSLLVFGVIASIITLAYFFSPPQIRKKTHPLILLTLLLIFAGGVLDLIHSLVKIPVIWDILGLLEDGGEMVVMSFIVWVLMNLYGNSFKTGGFSGRL